MNIIDFQQASLQDDQDADDDELNKLSINQPEIKECT